MESNYDRFWCLANALILLVSFLSPWYLVTSDVLPSPTDQQFGFEVALTPIFFVREIPTLDYRLTLLLLPFVLFRALGPALGLWFSARNLINFIRIRSGLDQLLFRWSTFGIPIVLAAISMGFELWVSGRLMFGVDQWPGDLLFGFHLAFIGLVSTSIVEL